MKNRSGKILEKYGHIFYKSIYNKAEYRIYIRNNRFKVFVFHKQMKRWISLNAFYNPRLAIREIEYIASGKKTEDFKKWLSENKVEFKYHTG